MSGRDAGLKAGPDLARAIAGALEGAPREDLAEAARRLSERYRLGDHPSVRTDVEALAYVAVRMPATYAAARAALDQLCRSVGAWVPSTQLDLGAGTGAVAWAAAAVWPTLREVLLVDDDARMGRVGAELASGAHHDWTWQQADVTSGLTPSDLVTACYVLGELGPGRAAEVALAAWRATTGCLLVVEPGTPAGFGLVRELRSQLIASGGTVVAPCPADGDCPMGEGDWCHFSARLARSALHRDLKGADRPFEDEKFSYVAVSRLPLARPAGRVLRHPAVRRRYVELTICTGDAVERRGVGRSSPAWREASRAAWGDGVSDGVASPAT